MNDKGFYWKLMNGTTTHTVGISWEEALELEKEYSEDFPDDDWWIQPDLYYRDIPKDEIRNIPKDAADGWEDLFNY